MDNLPPTVLLLVLSFGLGHAQQPIPPPNPVTTTTSTAPASSTTQFTPPLASGDYGPGSTSNPDNGPGISRYYFIFIAIFIVIASLGGFLVWWKKRRTQAMRQAYEEQAERRRTWQGTWHSAEASREEGLNEAGEAPPPYIPKTPEEVAVGNGTHVEPAIPLRTLSRELLGMKPPDYSEATVRQLGRHERSSVASVASSSRLYPGTEDM